MIDVLLTILVFFMTITSAQVLKVDKTIKLADRERRAEKRQHSRRSRSERALEATCEKGAIRFRRSGPIKTRPKWSNRSRRSDLPARKKLPRARTRLSARSSAAIAMCLRLYVSQAMNACAEAGITDISFSAVNKE